MSSLQNVILLMQHYVNTPSNRMQKWNMVTAIDKSREDIEIHTKFLPNTLHFPHGSGVCVKFSMDFLLNLWATAVYFKFRAKSNAYESNQPNFNWFYHTVPSRIKLRAYNIVYSYVRRFFLQSYIHIDIVV